MKRLKTFQLFEKADTDSDQQEIEKAEVTGEDIKRIKDILAGGYEEFVKKLKDNANDTKVQAILNMGKKDGIFSDEEIKVQDNVSIVCENLVPTQSQIGLADSLGWLAKNNPEGAAKLIKGDTSTFNENRILTANGKYILDGHHRWSQVYLFNPQAKIPSINLVIPGLDEKQILKVIQLAIASTYKGIFMKDANSTTDIFNDSVMSREAIKQKIPEIMGDKMIAVCKTAWNLDSNDKVIDKMTENAMKLKSKKPGDAPARLYMPQPSDTAETIGKRSKSDTNDFKGMPSEFINKLQSGDLNFKEPLLARKEPLKKENFKIKTFENFVQDLRK